MSIKVVPLGAGQDVGRSCILVSIGNKNIMLDCGMHMGYHDERRFPDFSFISKTKEFNKILDCVIISHFHLDHCGALPFFTEMCGYDGPIYMTYPTKAICPILLEDYRKITVERKGEKNFFSSQMIKNCMKKVIPLNLHQTIEVAPGFTIKPYYAGHVLGAAMFYVKVNNQSFVYTGDYNMTPDRHLGSAWIDRVKPDLLITETTYATTIRDSKRTREQNFLKRVHDCVDKGGKVLIPVFALGRAQELCILLETYWDRMNLNVPIYFTAGLAEKANMYYKLFINWTNEKIKKTFVHRNMFDFKHIKPFEKHFADQPGPMVLFATPGMLHAGTSLEVFKKWAGDPLNLCILPGYCVVGTVGNKLAAGTKGPVEIDKKTTVDVRCEVKSLSFSAHADSKGILQLIKDCEPKNVMLVHGEKGKMMFLKQRIIEQFKIPCFDPPNCFTIVVETNPNIPVDLSVKLLKKTQLLSYYEDDVLTTKKMKTDFDKVEPHLVGAKEMESVTDQHRLPIGNGISSNQNHNNNSFLYLHNSMINEKSETLNLDSKQSGRELEMVLVMNQDENKLQLLDPEEAFKTLPIKEHTLLFQARRKIAADMDPQQLMNLIFMNLSKWIHNVSFAANAIRVYSIAITSPDSQTLQMDWAYDDEDTAVHVLSIISQVFTSAALKSKG